MLFSKDQILKLLGIIENNTVIYIASTLGFNSLSDEDLNTLKRFGVDPKKFDIKGWTPAEKAFYFGRLSSTLGDKNTRGLKYGDFIKYMERGQYVPLTKREEYMLNFAKNRTYNHIKGLGEKISQTVNGIIIEEDGKRRAHYENIIGKEIERGVEQRKSMSDIMIEIGNKTGDWQRDLGRIVHTEYHNIMQDGIAAEIMERRGLDAEVWKDVFPLACRYCQKFYTTGGVGTKPRIYKLSELIANGTNIGRKVADWMPVVGSTHPWCFNSAATKILTADGYKRIEDIEVGDLVLTHKNRFRKVTELIFRDFDFKEDVFDIVYQYNFIGNIASLKTLGKITGNHPVLTNNGWIPSKDLKIGDKIFIQGVECEDCGNIIPLNYNKQGIISKCLSCKNRKTALKQWKQGGMRDKISKAVSIGNKIRMANMSLEERKKLTKKARQVYNDKYPNQSSPFFNIETRIKANKTNGKKATFIERKLRFFLDELKVDYDINFCVKSDEKKINGQYKCYFPDIYIPSLNIILEADGEKWHNKESDIIRDNKIKQLIGADIFRFTEDDILNNGDVVFDRISNIIKNHSGCFSLIEVGIKDIKKIKYPYPNNCKKLYNFSVEEDESYNADGVIVHNCRCSLHEIFPGQEWDEEKEQFRYPEGKETLFTPKKKDKITIGDKIYYV